MKRYNLTMEETEELYRTRKVEDIDMVKALRKAGWSVKKLAEEFRCTEDRMAEVMRKEGIV